MTTLQRSLAVLGSLALSFTLIGCGNAPAATKVTTQPDDVVGSVVTSDTGWTVTDVEGAGTSQGEIQLNRADGAEAKVNWRKADQYQSYLEDRSDLGPGKKTAVLGTDGLRFTYSDDDHTVICPVDGHAFIEVRVEGIDEAGFTDFLDSLSFKPA